MQKAQLELNDLELEAVKKLDTANAAVEICKIYFQRQNPKVIFPPSPNNADLYVQFPDVPGFDVEVKGTKESDIAWNQLKVSGRPSHDLKKECLSTASRISARRQSTSLS